MYREIDLSEVRANGWLKAFLKTQAAGMTGNLEKLGEPFSGSYWGESNQEALQETHRFLGGLNSKNDAWVPYEQTGYWIDGMVRTACLIDDEKLRQKVQPMIENPIRYADEDGFIGPAFLKDDMVWAHSVYFRALMAAYTETHDETILNALKKHYLRVPLKDVYKKHKDWRGIAVRDVCDIETALWIYGETGDRRFLTMAEESYKEFNRLFSTDRGVAPHCKSRALTIKGMLSEDKADSNHGVTYCEICKLAAILHMYTGKEVYKQAAVKAFDKVYRDNMIIDGVISSSEYLNGNADSRAVHETCDVTDFTWAVGYLFMITGDSKYGDWIENAVFNGGIGSVDDDFNAHQYFSCPNQVVCDDHSNHANFYKGEAWMSYSPTEVMCCCTGNVNRFMPNYVIRSWMKAENTLCAFLYGPSTLTTLVNGQPLKIEEITSYPFENQVRFVFHTDSPVAFTFKGRVPGWAKSCKVLINGEENGVAFADGFYSVSRAFSDGDVVEVSFEDEIVFIPNVGGVSVKKGALLYALPVKERIEMGTKVRGIGDPQFPHYALYDDSKWNYGIALEESENAVYVAASKVGEKPWKHSSDKAEIRVMARELPNWMIEKTTQIRQKLHPRKRGKIVDKECLFMPLVPFGGVKTDAPLQEIALVPYCTTRLRVAIFPIANKEA